MYGSSPRVVGFRVLARVSGGLGLGFHSFGPVRLNILGVGLREARGLFACSS